MLAFLSVILVTRNLRLNSTWETSSNMRTITAQDRVSTQHVGAVDVSMTSTKHFRIHTLDRTSERKSVKECLNVMVSCIPVNHQSLENEHTKPFKDVTVDWDLLPRTHTNLIMHL